MVLAAMKVKELKEEGRQEGREAQRKRQEEAYTKFGVGVNGVLMLPLTPEVGRFLAWESDE